MVYLLKPVEVVPDRVVLRHSTADVTGGVQQWNDESIHPVNP